MLAGVIELFLVSVVYGDSAKQVGITITLLTITQLVFSEYEYLRRKGEFKDWQLDRFEYFKDWINSCLEQELKPKAPKRPFMLIPNNIDIQFYFCVNLLRVF
jgi:hypothetical protein